MKHRFSSRLLAISLVTTSFFIFSFIPHQSAASIQPDNIGFRWQPTYPIYPSPFLSIRSTDSTDFRSFVDAVTDGEKKAIRGVYVEDVLAIPMIDQPTGQSAYVSDDPEEGTLFSKAVENGVTGVLAHNYLAGKLFYDLEPGQEVRVVFGDGRYRQYRITRSEQFQRLKPNDLRSDLIELKSGRRMSSGEVFNRFYSGTHRVTFQTCLARNGLSNWGLIFVEAEPVLP